MGRLRPLAVSFWRWFTGPASVAAILLVALYLIGLTAGPPLMALWLIGRAMLASTPAAGEAYARLGAQLAALGLVWYFARRFLPPFRWRA
jgi:hypothetical protein